MILTLKRPWVLAITWIAAITSLHAQSNLLEAPAMASPTAASLGEYGDIPVSHHTGIPRISLPLFSLSEGSLSLPVSLSYHSSGVKVDELASWAGLGWSLNAGGMITRSVVGAPDEGGAGVGSARTNAGGSGWYKDYGLHPGLLEATCMADPDQQFGLHHQIPIWGPDLSTPDPYDSVIVGYDNVNYYKDYECREYYLDAADGFADTQPDIFTFNVNGLTGKFFFDKNRKAHIQPEQDIQIIPNFVNTEFESWVLVGPDGTRYFFGGAHATEYGYTHHAGIQADLPQHLATTSWYLKRIESLNATHSIDFEYVPENYSFGNRGGHMVTYSGAQVSGSFYSASGILSLTSIKGMRLQRITTSSGNMLVDFIGGALREDLTRYESGSQDNEEARSLREIVFYTGKLKKRFELSTDYFVSDISLDPPNGYSAHDTKRLRLLSVREKSEAGSSLSPYVFTYNSASVARRYSLARDHWGYYNGANANEGLIPSVMDPLGNMITGLANRAPSEAHMKGWILEQIQYPTGGTAVFEYEAHRQTATSPIIGGLRVKKITTDAGPDSPDMVQNFTYNQATVYSHAPAYRYVIDQTNYIDAGPVTGAGVAGTLGYSFIYSANPLPALKTTQGYPIGYSIVTVENGANGSNGKTVYHYFNHSSPSNNHIYPPTPSQYDIMGGTLQKETHIDAWGQAIKETTYSYLVDYTTTVTARLVASMPGGGATVPVVQNYWLKTGRRLLSQKIAMMDGVTTTTDYFYSANQNTPIRTEVTNSDGKITRTESDFPLDQLSVSCSSNTSACLSTYQQTVSNLISGAIAYPSPSLSWQQFNMLYVQAQQDYMVCVQNELGGKKACETSAINALAANDPAIAEMIRRNYLAPLESRTLVGGQQLSGVKSAYTLQAFPGSAQGHLLAQDHFLFENAPGGTGQWTHRLKTLSDQYDNIIHYQKSSDQPIAFVWGHGGAFPIAKTLNASPQEIAFSSFETESLAAEENGGWTISDNQVVVSSSISLPPLASGANNGTLPAEVQSHDGSNVTLTIVPSGLASGYIAELVYTETSGQAVNSIPIFSNASLSLALDPGSYSLEVNCYDAHGTLIQTAGAVTLLITYTNTAYRYAGFDNNQKGRTGTRAFELRSGNQVSVHNLPPGEYLLSYFQKSGSAQTSLSGATSVGAQSLPAGPMGWEWIKENISITNSQNSVMLSGNQVFIDELRIHPADARMTTVTYDKRLQAKHITGPNHRPMEYLYDEFGRMSFAKDHKGNFVEGFKFHLK